MRGRLCLVSQLLISCFGIVYGDYLGCYRDSQEGLMNGYQQNFILTLVPDRCINLCTTKGFEYAGLKSSINCYCDHQAPPPASEESLCQAECVGDKTKICGGSQALSVYSTRLAQRAEMKEPILESFIGCYKDKTNDRLLSGYFQELSKNSPEKCKNICSRMGYLYSGVEYGSQCFCGDTHPPPALLKNNQECSTLCHANSDKKCGGNGRLAIYETGITDIPTLGMKLGCFDDEDPRVLEGYKIELESTNSPRRCMNLCKSLGYEYSGVEYMVECFCGNTVNANTSRDSGDEDCKATCPGDAFDTCGGNWKLMVYRTGLSDPHRVKKKLGCFKSNGLPVLKDFQLNFAQAVSSDKCAKICYNKGFYYSTVKFSIQCWCDNERPSQSLLVEDEECEETHAIVYETGYTVPQISHKEDYIGCFNDKGRGLGGFSHKFDSQLIPKKCSQLCFLKGYLYSGTENKNECHCGDIRPGESLTMVKYDECSSPCPGDRNKKCGGNGKLSIYSTGITDHPITGKLIGCFIDEIRPRALDGHKTDLEKTNSPRRCLNYCLQLGFTFAGVEYEKECFCGNSRPSSTLDASDSDCNSVCTGDNSQTCGGGWRVAVFRTGLNTYKPERIPDLPVEVTTPKPHMCEFSETLVNGKHACRGAVIFEDQFTASSIADHWKHEVKIADAPDFEFVTFTSDPANSFQKDGKLVIKPTLLPDRDVQNGTITLDGCTGLEGTRECGMMAFSYIILPPVRSARIHTRKSFSFRYGVVEIRARLPAGDWLVPELWLMPKDQSYGSNYLSGKIRVAMSRGNRYLTYEGMDIGSSTLESGVLVGTEGNVSPRSVTNRIVDSWYAHTHNYTLVWTPDNLSFYVDGRSQQALLPPGARLTELIGFNKTEVSAWNTGSRIAPFDTDFYLSLGVSAGSVRDFPDGCISRDKVKPWTNFKLKAMLSFWLDKASWQPSWDEKSLLTVDHVRVTAL